jgi:hypothetical protein
MNFMISIPPTWTKKKCPFTKYFTYIKKYNFVFYAWANKKTNNAWNYRTHHQEIMWQLIASYRNKWKPYNTEAKAILLLRPKSKL